MKDEFLEGIIELNSTGSAYLLQEKDDIYIYKKNLGQALHGDKVKVKLIKGKQPGSVEGKVVEVLTRNKLRFVGILEKSKKYGFVIPDSKKMFKDIFIERKECEDYEHGEKVLCELTHWYPDAKNPNGKIVKSLGFPGDNDAEINSIVYEYEFDTEFDPEVEEEAESINFEISEEEIKKRRDFRKITTLTIDPNTAKDFDDALSVQRLKKGNIEVGIHIADVSHYVKEGSRLDKEAFRRGTSVYLVDRVIPMLPERLSNGVCSLRPHEDKLAFSAVFELDNDGVVQKEWFGRTVIHSDRRFTYEEAQEIIEGGDGDFKSEILLLDKLAKKIRKRRIKDSITFNKVEVKFKIDEETGKPLSVFYKESKDANKLIEEFMLLANKKVAKFISDMDKTFVYRTHDTPNEDKLMELSVIVNEFGHSLTINDDNIKAQLNKLLKDVQGTPEQNMVEALAVRTMSKAKYEVPNIGHYGLGFTHYSHFTSPIRRYPDLMVHRLLQKYLENPKKNINPAYIDTKCKWCSSRELNASRAERDSIKFKQVEFLMDKIGHVYEAVITGVTDWGVYAEIIENKCEGMIHKDKLMNKGYVIDPDKYSLEGEKTYRLGDIILINIADVNLNKKEIDFDLI